MRPTRVTPPAAHSAPMKARLVLNLLRLRIEASELPVPGLLHAQFDRTRRQQGRARLARNRVLELDAFLVETVDETAEGLALVTEVAALHAHPHVAAEQQ